MERRTLGFLVFGVCAVVSGAVSHAADLEHLRYRFKAVDAAHTALTPTAMIAVVLGDSAAEQAVRTGLGALGVNPSRVSQSMLAGTLLVDATTRQSAEARAALAKDILAIPGVRYVAPVTRTLGGIMLAKAPRLHITRAANQDEDGIVPSVDLTTDNGFEIEAVRRQVADNPDIADVSPAWFQVSSAVARYVVPETPATVTRYLAGVQEVVPAETVWRPMCGTAPEALSVEQLKEISDANAQVMRVFGDEQTHGSVAATPGLDVRFTFFSALPPGAGAAISAVETFLETQFDDPVTVNINLTFASLGSGILGSTGSSYLTSSYGPARDALQADMDIDDTIQDFLPGGTTLPVRYDGNTEVVTNETRVFITRANFNSYVGVSGGTAASMTFSTNFSWDYTPPSITPSTWDFQSVLVHEVGHALGFTSGADFRFNDLETLDLYRFQRSDGDGTDHNPDTIEEFETEPRMVDQNAPLINDDVNSDLISVEYQMSDGNPRQASHFHDQTPAIGIMDPTLASGQTFFPDFLRTSDGDMFDAIGWDFPSQNFCRQDPPARNVAELDGSRYVSFLPPDAVEPIAVRVRLISLLDPLGGPPAGSPDFSGSEGEVRWVGAPVEVTDSASQGTTLFAAPTTCEPVCMDWSTFDAVHVYGGEIVPSSIYDIQAIRCSCDAGVEKNFSDALTVSTSHWGDAVEPFRSAEATVQPDFGDIAALVAKFLGSPTAITKARTQLQPNLVRPTFSVDFKDISAGVNAFLDGIFGFEGPCVCPSIVTCGATACSIDGDCGGGFCINNVCTDACGRCSP